MINHGSKRLVLVTGGGGYIGSALIPALLAAGYEVRVLDLLLFGTEGLEPYRGQIEIVQGDLRRPPADLLDEVYAVINLGGLSAEPAAEYRPEANREINHLAAVNLARSAKKRGVERFIQASSGSIYDVGAGNPEKDVLHTEDTPVHPFRIYSITKYQAEREILALADERFTTLAYRKGSVYGYAPRMRMDLVLNTFVGNAMRSGELILHNGGEMWRPLLHIGDAVQAYLLGLAAPAAEVRGQLFNAITLNVRISELALRVQAALREVGVECRLLPDYEPRNLRSCQASNRKIREVLGFQPGVGLREAVHDLVARIKSGELADPFSIRWNNIKWLDALEAAQKQQTGAESVFDLAPEALREVQVTAAVSA